MGRYVSEILKRLQQAEEFKLYLLSGNPLNVVKDATSSVVGSNDENIRIIVPFPFRAIVRRYISEPFMYRSLKRKGVDVLWGTNYFLPRLQTVPWKKVITVHDLAWRVYPESIQRPMVRMLDRLGEHVDVADRVFTVSEFTKRELVGWLGSEQEKVTVIRNGVDPRFHQLASAPAHVRERYGLPPYFLLFVGTIEPRKNLERLIAAFNLVAPKIKHTLVIVGARGWKISPIYGAVSASPFRDRILFTGFVDDVDLPTVYNLADAFVYPSCYEGFGIPVIEAMACGTPVVTSNVSALPEVAGDAALLIDPFDVRGLAGAMERIVHDKPLRATLRAKGLERAKRFSWDTSAEQVVQCFRDLCG